MCTKMTGTRTAKCHFIYYCMFYRHGLKIQFVLYTIWICISKLASHQGQLIFI